jgi:hypothetical protein
MIAILPPEMPNEWAGWSEADALSNGCSLPLPEQFVIYRQHWAGKTIVLPEGWTYRLCWYQTGRALIEFQKNINELEALIGRLSIDDGPPTNEAVDAALQNARLWISWP